MNKNILRTVLALALSTSWVVAQQPAVTADAAAAAVRTCETERGRA